MMFFGLFVLIVLPIFLILSAKKLKTNPNFKDNPAAGFIRFIFYLFAGMAILADLIIIARIIKWI